MKKILIDAVSLLSPLTGIGRYTYEVSKRLQKLSARKYEIFFNYGYHSRELYASAVSIPPANEDGPSSSNTAVSSSRKREFIPALDLKNREYRTKKLHAFIKKHPFLKKISRRFYVFIARYYAASYELYWQPSFIPNPNIKARKVVCTVHDFSFMLQPHWHPKERIEYFMENFDSIKKADRIITGSNFTKREIIRYMQMPEDKISVIYHGVDHELYRPYPQNELQLTKDKFDLPQDFLLFVGSIEPRKNILTLLKAYGLLGHEEKTALPLVLVGFKGWENEAVMQEIEKNREFIRYLGFVSDAELSHIYNLCTIFIYPSLYEGFGLPPLEAMACGAPVIVSDAASLPEVCGGAALYVDPTDAADIKGKISTFANDEKLREEFSRKSKAQAARFSWDESARGHFEVFEKFL